MQHSSRARRRRRAAARGRRAGQGQGQGSTLLAPGRLVYYAVRARTDLVCIASPPHPTSRGTYIIEVSGTTRTSTSTTVQSTPEAALARWHGATRRVRRHDHASIMHYIVSVIRARPMCHTVAVAAAVPASHTGALERSAKEIVSTQCGMVKQSGIELRQE